MRHHNAPTAIGLILVRITIALVVFLPPFVTAVDRTLYTVSPSDADLRVIDPLSGSTITSFSISVSGATVLGANGLARDPTTGKLWALLQLTGQPGRELVTINPANGVATRIGNTGDNFAGLAFKSDGVLYGVTGDGAAIPERLFTLSKSTGVPVEVKILGNGNDGEAIGFNPDDGLIYHASGNDTESTRLPAVQIFETINPANLGAAPVNITRSGDDYLEAIALTYQSGNRFLLAARGAVSGRLLTITTTGVASPIGSMDHDAKGLAFLPKPPTDFDADVKADAAVYQTSTGNWFAVQSTAGFGSVPHFGGSGFIPVPGDYDGDGAVDAAVYGTATGNWFVNGSSAGFFTPALNFGGAGYVPVPGDYDGDGKTDAGVYQTSTGNWFVVRSSSGIFSPAANFGGSGFVPVPGDYDGDGKTDAAVYQTNTGNWFVIRSSAGFFSPALNFGGSGFVPMPGDYDGDGKTDVAVYQTSTGNWFAVRSSSGFFSPAINFGGSGFLPVAADYDGDGKTDAAVYQTNTGNWFAAGSTDGSFSPAIHFGGTGFVPVLPQVTILRALGLL